MEKLSTFQFNNTRKLFELAKLLNASKFFELFLNESQFKILNYIISLNDFDVWFNFLEGNCFIKFLNDKSEDVTEEEKPHEVVEGINGNNMEIDDVGKNEPDQEDVKKDNNNEEDDKEKVQETEEKKSTKDEEDKKEESDNSQDTLDKDDKAETESPEILFDEGDGMIKLLALHIRYLLWEKAIDFYYNSKSLDESFKNIEEVSDDYKLIDSLDDIEDEQKPNGTAEVDAPAADPIIREEEDDYDDDEDEEEEKEEKSSEIELADASENKITFNEDNQAVLEIPISILKIQSEPPSTSTETAPSTSAEADSEQNSTIDSTSKNVSTDRHALEDQEKLIKEFNKVYHNFEYDRETLLKRRKLEKSDLKLENIKKPSIKEEQEQDEKEDGGDDHANVPINLGTESNSLKHLLSTIKHKRDNIQLNDFELRTLFMDVRKNRGKWANDERVGQEDLYEACEKVVLELRSYTEHSTPFLNKVSKREAPNYGLIIKKPMDLNTVMKKLKALSYNSKQEFVEDLMLIWANCLTYNADPKHFLRAHAIAMQKKTLKLSPTIPNITIRNRADIEKEEELEADTKAGTPFDGTGGGKSVKKGRKRTRQDQIVTEEAEPSTPLDTPETPAVEETPVPAPSNEVTEAPAEETNHASADEEEEEDDDEGENEANGETRIEEEEEFDPELQAWRSLTAKSRANYCAQRSDLFDENNHLRSDANAIIREPKDMRNFGQYLNNTEVMSKSTNLLENDELYLMEYDITGGLPGLKYKGIDKEEEDRRENHLVDVFLQQANGDASNIQSSFILPTDSGLNKIYHDNISEIQEIRKICFKISLIRQMQTQQFVHHTQMKQPEIEKIREVDVDAASKLANHDHFSKDVQFAVLRRNMCKVAMQTGFETTESSAINTLTHVAERYMSNLIKSLKMHSETNSDNKRSQREILLMSLLENGVDKPDDLYTFVKEKILKQQDKLKDLRVKLSNFLKELLRPGLKNFNERSFEDNSEQFMTGDFSSELGDDFFGFKELGLDKEFKMISSSIPIYLLHSRLHNSYTSAGDDTKRNKYEDLQEYEPLNLVANDVAKQVGLLRPFYTKLLEKSKTHFIKMQKKKGESTELPDNNSLLLIEDEELPLKQRNIRPRLPPTGKISSVKKRIVSTGFFIPDEEVFVPDEEEPKIYDDLGILDTIKSEEQPQIKSEA